jgi:hypothetical protein
MDKLLQGLYEEPAIRYKLTVQVLGSSATSENAIQASRVVRGSPLVQKILSACAQGGGFPLHPYKKWSGSHWVLSLLADLGYPHGDEALIPLMEQASNWLLSREHARYIREINGRVRRCASQESNLVYSSLTLGLADSRTSELAERLIQWQWPDGGWNCDKRPDVKTSSFMESLIPLRALALYAKISRDPHARIACEKAAEIFLKRKLYVRLSDGKIMDPHFVQLHYPCYWHYDILFALKVMAEAGFIADPRCKPALDLLESRRLPDGGFPADATYYQTTRPEISNYSPVKWGGVSKKKSNPFVTVDALAVLRESGRSSI